MSDSKLDREGLREEGDRVKQDVLLSLVEAKDVKLLPDKYNEFLVTAMTVYGCVIRGQVFEAVSKHLAAGTLTEQNIDTTLGFLCRRLDQEAEKLANQVDLIQEVRYGPELRN